MTCRKAEPFAFDAVFAIFPYIGKYRQLLKAYKFGKNKNLARFFALKLLETPFARAAEAPVWVPVPPRAGKIKAAGWDQVEEIAKIIEKTNSVQRCLKRLPSKSQKELDKGTRLTNLKGKIRCVKNPAKNVVLFDDVFTTGSTLSVCAEELKNHGAERVCGVCLFYD
jgi:ComF family protein